MWWILIVIAAVALIALLISMLAAKFMLTAGNRQTPDEALKWQSDHYDTSFYTNGERTAYTVESYDGYILHAELLKCPEESTKYIIISHGYTDNRIGSLKYAKMYLKLGFNCVIYDLRGHGENERTFTTYGIREGQDLSVMVKDTRSRYKDISVLGLHGESLGAASTMASMKYKPEVDFAVSDCGFSNILGVLKPAAKIFHAPAFLINFAEPGVRLRYHYSLNDMRPIDSLDDNTVPILFIHGSADTFILPRHSQDMFDRTKGIKEIHFIPGAEHAESMLREPVEYQRIVEGFLAKLA